MEETRPPPIGRLLRRPSFGRLLFAGVASSLGTAIAELCLTWVVFASTSSALDVGYYGASALAGGITFSVLGGTLVDRYDRRRLMILADLARAGAVGGLFLDLELWGFSLTAVLVTAFVVTAFATIFNPAEQSAIPQVVPGPEVGAANALVRSTRAAVGFAGAALAGVIIVLGSAAEGLGVNVITFGISALLLSGLSLPPTAARGTSARPTFLAELRDGFVYLRHELGLFQLTISATFFNFFQALVATFLVVYVAVLLHGTALQFAAVVGAELLGGTLGSFVAARTRAEHSAGRAWVVAYGIGGGAGAVVLGVAPFFPIVAVTAFTMGLLSSYAGTAWLTASQRYVPPAMQGRYFGIDALGSIGIIPISQIGGGLLIERFQVGPTYLFAGLMWLTVGLVFLLPRSLRRWGYRAPPSDLHPPGPDRVDAVLPTAGSTGPVERILFPPGSP